MDLVDAYAFPLPIAVISELLGVPYEDRDQVRIWSHAFVTDSTLDGESKARAGQDWFAYLVALIEEKRSAPGPDLLSALIEESQDNDRLDPQELISMVFLLMLAGHETTVSLIGNAVYALLRHPEQLERLRADPALLPGAVEEVLRYESPVHIPSRRVTLERVTIGDVEIPAGQFVHFSLSAVNRDGNKYPDPARFDITRDARGHLAFGHGIHFCVGAPLARMEGEIALRKLLERYPRLELGAQDPSFSRRTSMLVYSLKSLPVSFSTATSAPA
uniref:cytochrome P450 n=1 Tax=Paractinoplanes polyasparticus TaxID=2856853 RepID=UPI001C859CBB|nr:cytochrome P450 [Actinoplanes polyasparticus]